MTNKLLLLILLIDLISFSCKNDDSTVIANPASYLLKRQIWTGPATNGSSFLYIYGSDHLVSRIEQYQWEITQLMEAQCRRGMTHRTMLLSTSTICASNSH